MSSPQAPLGSRVALVARQITPSCFPDETFDYYSIPALDEHGGAVAARGSSIESGKFLLSGAAVLVSKLNPRKMRVQLFRNDSQRRSIASTEFMVFEPIDADKVAVRYLRHLLESEEFAARLQAVATGTTNSHVRARPTDALQWKSSFPPPEEQRRIAEILDTIDESIQATERLIAKLSLTRIGLLKALLSPSLSHSNPLPSGWSVLPIGELLGGRRPSMRSGPFGSSLLSSDLTEDGVPLLGIDNVEREQFVSNFKRFVSIEKARELSRYRVFPDDLMITIMGTVGKCCVVPSSIDHALSSKHVWTITLEKTRYLPELACLQVNYSPWVTEHFGRDEQGGIMSAIRSDTLRSLHLPTPPMEEQERILSVMKSLSDRLAQERDAVGKLRITRNGLAADLLSGRVRTVAS